MNWFKRLCLFLFGLSGVLSLVALSLVWVGPWTPQARTLITENRWYFWALEILVCIAGAGSLICMLVALFSPRSPKESVVAEVEGGQITITRNAVTQQTRHIVEADGTCAVASVRVSMRKRGNVRVRARVTPHLPVDIVKRGAILHAELEEGLAKVCGDSVRSIDLVFTEPEQQGSLSMYVDDAPDVEEKATSATSASVPRTTGAKEVTIPMGNREDTTSQVASEDTFADEGPSGREDQDATAQMPEVSETAPVEDVAIESESAPETETTLEIESTTEAESEAVQEEV